MSDATDNRFYREPAAPVVAGDLRERVIDKALDVLADAAVATQDEGSERLAGTMLAVVQPELERLTKLAEANGGQARFWADHFAEIERANRDALGAHHKPGHSVAELITALIGELAEVREFGNDAMNSTHTKAQEIAKWVEGYGKLSADNKRLTRERDEARAEVSRLERCYDAVKERAERAEARPAIPADRPPVVCLCGSMRFEDEIRETAREESIFGHIVVLPLCNMKQPHPLWNDKATAEYLKTALDSLHKAKIDLADEIVVVSDATGYVGDSTRSEIAYAEAHGKPVRYWSAPVSGSSGAVRAGLLAKYGPCTCQAGECVEDVTDCAPCSHLDPYWDCFAESAPVSGSDTATEDGEDDWGKDRLLQGPASPSGRDGGDRG